MKFMFGTLVGMFAGIVLCATWLHTHYLPEQYDYQRALARCDADKNRVGIEVMKINNYLRGLR